MMSFLPELFLAFCILFQLIFNAFLVTTFKQNFPILMREIFSQTLFILLCLLILYTNLQMESYLGPALFGNDLSTYSIKQVFIVFALFLLVLLIKAFKLEKLNFFEYFSLFLISILALLLLISATDLLAAYLVIEMQTIAFYILASFTRSSAFSTDAGLKYFIAGAFFSGLFLFGCSVVYISLGTLNLEHIKLLLAFPFEQDLIGLEHLLLIGSLLITITFFFKLGGVPFHFWVPDVYDGAPLASTILFTILPKLALFYFFIKWLGSISTVFPEILHFLYKIGFLSIIVGAYFALVSNKLKRLLVFSSISQTGFLFVSLSLLSLSSITHFYFFLIVYLVTALILWSQFLQLYAFQNKVHGFYKQPTPPIFISTLQNLVVVDRLWGLTFLVVLFSMAGLPPLSGFWAKVFILLTFIGSYNIIDSLLLLLSSAFAVFYYIKLVKIVFFESTALMRDSKQMIILSTFFISECLLITSGLFLLFFWFWSPELLLLFCERITLTTCNL